MDSRTTTDTLRIAQVMTPNPCTVALDLSLADAQERMYVNNIRHLVVLEDGRVRGVLSTRDVLLLTNLMKADARDIKVAAAMTDMPYTCSPDTPVVDVVQEMERKRYGCVVVVQGRDAVGMFTTTDALRVLRAQLLGHPVEPKVKPTHMVDQPEKREKVEHRVRVGDSVSAASSTMGRAFDTTS